MGSGPTAPRGAARLAGALAVGLLAVPCMVAGVRAGPSLASAPAPIPSIHPRLFAAAPAGLSHPDDITRLGDTLYVGYQNGVGGDGSPAGSTSTVVAFDPRGSVLARYPVPGRVEGLSADPMNNRLLATVNDQNNSSLYILTPGAPSPLTHYAYQPSPAQPGRSGTQGGTASVAVGPNGALYVAHSNPANVQAPNNPAAVYRLGFSGSSATITGLFGVNDPARIVNPSVAGRPFTLGLTDPDSNRFIADNGGTLIQLSQSSAKIAFAFNLSAPAPSLYQLYLGNAVTPTAGPAEPRLDDIDRVTGQGTLYAVDGASGGIYAIDTAGVAPGTWFVSQPKPGPGDPPNDPALAVVDLTTGLVTHVDSTLQDPRGLLFMPAAQPSARYWEVTARGQVLNFGAAGQFAPPSVPAGASVVGLAPTASGQGYWEVTSGGQVLTAGDAARFGSPSGTRFHSPVVGMAATPDGGGYWLVAADGGVFAYGDAGFYGSGSRAGRSVGGPPVVGMAATPDGKGYWLVTADGKVSAYGDAGQFGSRRGAALNRPVVGIVPSADGLGYWLVAGDGGVFAYGDARFYGSRGDAPTNGGVVGMVADPSGPGYWEAASDGGIFAYGDAPFLGSAAGTKLSGPVVGLAG